MSIGIRETGRPNPDTLLVDIANYITDFDINSKETQEIARYCLMDIFSCGLPPITDPSGVQKITLMTLSDGTVQYEHVIDAKSSNIVNT